MARPATGSAQAELAALERQEPPTLAGRLAPVPAAALWVRRVPHNSQSRERFFKSTQICAARSNPKVCCDVIRA